MSKTLQTVYCKAVNDIGQDCLESTQAYLYTEQEHQAAQGYMDALERILNAEGKTTMCDIARKALPAATTQQEECCGRCVGHCYLDNESKSIELTSLVPRDTNVMDELEKWVKDGNYFTLQWQKDIMIPLNDVLSKIQSLSAAPTQQTNVLEYYQNARTEFCSKIDNLDVHTRTACDSFLLAFDHLLQSLKPQP
jgi:hypothetical protein